MKKLLAIIMSLVTLLSMASISASASSWKTGNFSNYNSGYTTVYLKDAKKNGKVKIHTYNCVKGSHSGKCFGSGETKAKLRVTFRTTSNKYICAFNSNSKTTLKLGKDHSAYKINLAIRQDLGSADNFINAGKCTHWAIETNYSGSNTRF